jgi:translation initiation factor 2 subunit 1
MLYKKTGLPEDSELVLCTVNKVLPNSVFVTLDEYGIDGLIHISEVSPGRIRNIRDFVKEGKKVVCKVLKVYMEKGQVDVSLRRVNEGQRRNKIMDLKQEEKAEKILEYVAKSMKKDPLKFYQEVTPNIFKKYDGLHNFFIDLVNGETKMEEYGLEKSVAHELDAVIKQRLRPAEVSIKGSLMLVSHAPDGVDVIKGAIKKALLNDNVEIKYLGGGKYDVVVKAKDYPEAEEIMEKASTGALAHMKAKGGLGEFSREK